MENEQTRYKLERLKEERAQKEKESKQRGEKLSEQALKMVKKRNVKPFWERWGDPIGYSAITLVVLTLVILNYTGDRRNLRQILVNDDAFIQAHNEGHDNHYILASNEYFQGASLQDAQKYFANELSTKKSISKCETTALKEIVIPNQYNFYEVYPQCKSSTILNKGTTSYVEIPLEIYKDRLCQLELNEYLTPSLDFFINCNTKVNRGIKGGYLLSTLFFMRKGFIGDDCWKKTVESQAASVCPLDSLKQCSQNHLSEYCKLDDEDIIKKDILKNGPLISVMRPYRDFLVYRSGIYDVKDRSKLEGIVFVKIVGWGQTEEGIKYWLIDPLWGTTWGQEGIARVKINSEDSLLEKYAFTLYPDISQRTSQANENTKEFTFTKPNIYIETE